MKRKLRRNISCLRKISCAPWNEPARKKEAHGEIETAHSGYLGAQDTYYVGTIKGVGRIYQQTFLDTYAKVGFAKLYDRKTALVAADLLNDRVLPFFEEDEMSVEYCGQREHHASGIKTVPGGSSDHSLFTMVRQPQTNGICERFHRTMQEEFYATAFRKSSITTWTNWQMDSG